LNTRMTTWGWSAALFWVLIRLSNPAFAQSTASAVPYGGGNSEEFPPFQRVRPIPPDPPSPADQNVQRLPNGYTQQQMEWLKANPRIVVHPDGTIEHLRPSQEEIMQAVRNNPNPPNFPQPAPGWNSRDASDPQAMPTPGISVGGVPGSQPIKPLSK
jgi:hypothetical protein